MVALVHGNVNSVRTGRTIPNRCVAVFAIRDGLIHRDSFVDYPDCWPTLSDLRTANIANFHFRRVGMILQEYDNFDGKL